MWKHECLRLTGIDTDRVENSAGHVAMRRDEWGADSEEDTFAQMMFLSVT